MLERIENEKDFIVFKATAKDTEAMGGMGICDHCNEFAEEGYLVAVLNHYLCEKCYQEFITRAKHYPEDEWYEKKNAKVWEDFFAGLENEKVPCELQLDKGTNKNNQFDVITDFLNCQMHKMIEGFEGINKITRVISIEISNNMKISLQLIEDDFIRVFGQGEKKPFIDTYDKMFAIVDGVEVFCLCKKEEK